MPLEFRMSLLNTIPEIAIVAVNDASSQTSTFYLCIYPNPTLYVSPKTFIDIIMLYQTFFEIFKTVKPNKLWNQNLNRKK